MSKSTKGKSPINTAGRNPIKSASPYETPGVGECFTPKGPRMSSLAPEPDPIADDEAEDWVRFGWSTYRCVLQEGFDAYKVAGPFARCPYGADERNGIWVFAKQKAKQGLSFSQVCRSFRQMEGLG